MTRTILSMLIIFAIGFGFGYIFWKPGEQLTPWTTVYTDTVFGDSVPYPVYYPAPIPVWRDTGSTRWKYHPVDTNAILTDYFSRNAYVRVLKDDSSAYAAIYDTVSQNSLTSFRFEFQNRKPTTVTTTAITQPSPGKAFIYIGPSMIYNSFGGHLQYTDKRWTATAGATGQGVYVSVGLRIWQY